MMNRIYDWLSQEDVLTKADLIFVLAGLQSRKEYAATLLREGIAPQVLFSIDRFEIRRFATLRLHPAPDLLRIAKNISPPDRHFFVLLKNGQFEVNRIPVRKLGTLSEVDALADWLPQHPEITSLLLISSGTHLRRLRLCCRALLSPKLRIYMRATPQANSSTDRTKQRRPEHDLKEALFEMLKIACYSLFLPVWRMARQWRSKTIHTLNS
jgi:hypothetical protein